LFPRKAGKQKKGDASAEDVKGASSGTAKQISSAFPIKNVKTVEEANVADFESTEDAYKVLRTARSDARLVGKREKRAKAKNEEEKEAKK